MEGAAMSHIVIPATVVVIALLLYALFKSV